VDGSFPMKTWGHGKGISHSVQTDARIRADKPIVRWSTQGPQLRE